MKTSSLIILLLFSVCFANSHSAVHLSSSKTGSAIIVPFYTVSNQMNTLVSLNNTTDGNKAVKVHIKEAQNGDILASFNVYLTGQDMWTMGMGQVPSINGARLRMVSNDQSCTIGFPNNVDIAIDEEWLWENGTIEIIEMGTVNDVEALQTMENDCEAITNHWQTGQMWANDSENQMSAATGGLHAEVTLMDVEQGHSSNIPVIHMDGFYGEDNIQHTAAGDETPNISTGTKDSMIMLGGQLIATTWPTGYEAVSALLMHDTLVNEFNLENAVAAQTEWIVSFPTIHYHFSSENESITPFKTSLPGDTAFWFPTQYSNTDYFNREGELKNHYVCGGCSPRPPEIEINSVIDLIIYQNTNQTDPNTTLAKPDPMMVSSFNDNTHYLNASIDHVNNLATDYWSFDNGKIRLELGTGFEAKNDRGVSSTNPEEAQTYYGMPAVGFSYTRFTNANAQPGLLAQYAFVRKHFGERKVVISEE